MKRTLRIIIGLALLTTAIITGVGCQCVKCCDSCPTETALEVVPKIRASSRVVTQGCSNIAEVNTELVCLQKKVPCEASIGQSYVVEIDVEAHEDAANVLITDRIPQEARFVRSEPGAVIDGDKMTWRVDTLGKGKTTTITYWLEPLTEGKLCGNISIGAMPQAMVDTFVGQPSLACTLECPPLVQQKTRYPIEIAVTNKGTTTARDVVVTETLGQGLRDLKKNKRLTWEIGDLKPGETHRWTTYARAPHTGSFRTVLTASGSNTPAVARVTKNIAGQPGVAVFKDKSQKAVVGKTVNYTIAVTNASNTALQHIVAKSQTPTGMRICSAEGACHENHQATWTIQHLDPGEIKTFDLVLSAHREGRFDNTVTVTSANGPSAENVTTTEWQSRPPLTIVANSENDPILCGSDTTFRIIAVNQGHTADHNAQITVQLPPELIPQSAQGATRSRIDGQVVTFEPFTTLQPKQCVDYTITTRAVREGKVKIQAELVSDTLTTPMVEEERTYVY